MLTHPDPHSLASAQRKARNGDKLTRAETKALKINASLLDDALLARIRGEAK